MVVANESVPTRITQTAEQQLCPHCAKYYRQKMCESIGRVNGATDNMIRLKRRPESVKHISGYRYDWDLNQASGKVPP
jgi:hypothetical protein